jgi:hypothetical protein
VVVEAVVETILVVALTTVIQEQLELPTAYPHRAKAAVTAPEVELVVVDNLAEPADWCLMAIMEHILVKMGLV